MNSAFLFWLCATVVFLIVEAVTPAMISIWFAFGSLVACISSYFDVENKICVIIFVVASAISLVLFKIFVGDRGRVHHQRTNADRFIGAEGIVKDDIDPVKGAGSVLVSGQLWSAKAGEKIAKDSTVKVTGIEGVKLVVEICEVLK